MHRRGFATVALVLLVSLSGCSLLGGGTAPAAETPTPPSPSGSTATPDRSPTPGGDGGSAGAYPAGYGADGVADWHDALTSHVESLNAHDSYLVRYNGTGVRGDRIATIAIVQAAEVSEEEAYVLTDVTGQGTLTYYYEDATRYRRFDPPGANGTEYSSEAVDYSMESFTGASLVRPLLENVSYGGVERLDRDGGTFYRYTATDYRNPSSLFGPVDPENVSAFRAAIVVDEEGIVRRLAYRARLDRGGESVHLDVRAEVVGVDSTTVERPDWFERAR